MKVTSPQPRTSLRVSFLPMIAKSARNSAGIAPEIVHRGVQAAFDSPDGRTDRGNGDAETHRRDGQRIRDQAVFGVDPAGGDGEQDHGPIGENGADRLVGKPDFHERKHEQHSGQGLDDQIATGVGFAAAAAAAPQHEVADNRDIVVPADLIAALGAMGGCGHDRFAERQPPDADVQKAAEATAEYEHREKGENRHRRIFESGPEPPFAHSVGQSQHGCASRKPRRIASSGADRPVQSSKDFAP